jgi:SAM-dependent methyltransferase
MVTVERLVEILSIAFRNLLSKQMFKALESYCQGDVLDVGGASFYSYVREMRLRIATWTSLDVNHDRLNKSLDSRHTVVIGDGCDMQFADASFDAVVNSQVLEHVMEPLKMVSETSRVLKPRGHVIFLIPQTACVHAAPHCYYNFTIYWIREALKRNNLEIVEEHQLGGVWSTALYHHIYFFLQAFRVKGFTFDESKRSRLFYVLLPFMVAYALVSLPLVAILSLGDLKEEPNNHLVVARKQ